jgi:hypothetical protein
MAIDGATAVGIARIALPIKSTFHQAHHEVRSLGSPTNLTSSDRTLADAAQS